MDEAIAERERAFEQYVTEGDCDRAARAAVWISHQYHLAGRSSGARGWLARAERALEGVSRCSGHGWVAVERARHAQPSRSASSTPSVRWRSRARPMHPTWRCSR